LNLVSSFFSNFLENIREAVKEEVNGIIRRLVRVVVVALAGITLLLIGLFYLSVGVVKYFTVVFGSEALAYGVVGIILVLGGTLLLLVSVPRRGRGIF
jgi:predicted membrane protein